MKHQGEITVAPLASGSGELRIDIAKALKVISAISSLCLGPKGVPTFLSNIGEISKVIARELKSSEKSQSQGFALFVGSLTSAVLSSLSENTPEIVNHDDSPAVVSRIVANALLNETINVSSRFLATPALNPAFIRVREALLTLLERPSLKIDSLIAERVVASLGAQFAKSLESAVREARSGSDYTEFLAFLDENSFTRAANRAWMWDDYRANLNRQVYRRLFLHELEGHPEVSLPDVYIPSRSIYRDVEENISDGNSKSKVFCVDLEAQLRGSWLNLPILKTSHSRLVTGDPGTGKSTFALMFTNKLATEGYRVLFIQANSIRSLGLSFQTILEKHLQRTLHLEASPNIEGELADVDANGKPLFIVLDGLDEYDVGGATVSLAAGRLVEHVMTVMDEWRQHGHDVRLLLCGRPEAASSITRFRDPGTHLHVTGFVYDLAANEEPANESSKTLMAVDQRQAWWSKWQALCGDTPTGLPNVIASGGREVAEITAQPLLNYMLAVLKLYGKDSLTNLSALYGSLFERYFERQKANKSGNFEKVCPTIERFRRIMSEIGIAAWHAGDRSVSTDDLQERFNKPPLRSWFDQAGTGNSGLGAILTAFYTRPEDSANPDSGLAQRYVFSHKSFREYLTGVGIVRFLEKLADQLSADAEDGWSDQDALREWVILFGPTSFDQRQWQFLLTELQSSFSSNPQKFQRVKQAVEQVFGLALRRLTPLLEVGTIGQVTKSVGNAEEAMICVLDALRRSDILPGSKNIINVSWPDNPDMPDSSQQDATLLSEMLHRIRSRPGSPDEMMLGHLACLFEQGGQGLLRQVRTEIRTRADGWLYAQSFDFTGMDLTSASLQDAYLLYGKFHRATVSGANFSRGRFVGADFGDVGPDGSLKTRYVTNFNGADLSQTRWTSASLNASFEGAILFGADMRGTDVDLRTAADIDHVIEGPSPYRERHSSSSNRRTSQRTNRSRSQRPSAATGSE